MRARARPPPRSTPSGDQDVLPSERLGGEDLSAADQGDHGRLLLAGDRALSLARPSGPSQAARPRPGPVAL
ncbi:MAG: hypothetical protein MZV64_33655 [Ignavibacteriales bacterium]|nr:hypothetical protein [Ignavibacteriales bacterium]